MNLDDQLKLVDDYAAQLKLMSAVEKEHIKINNEIEEASCVNILNQFLDKMRLNSEMWAYQSIDRHFNSTYFTLIADKTKNIEPMVMHVKSKFNIYFKSPYIIYSGQVMTIDNGEERVVVSISIEH